MGTHNNIIYWFAGEERGQYLVEFGGSLIPYAFVFGLFRWRGISRWYCKKGPLRARMGCEVYRVIWDDDLGSGSLDACAWVALLTLF